MKFQVCEKPCNQCLFSKNRIVPAARMREILAGCKRDDAHFICHKASIAGREVCCRAFFDTRDTNLIRVAGRLGMIEFVDPSTGKPSAALQPKEGS